MEERSVRLSGGELSYLYKTGGGPALILLHGAGNRAYHLGGLAAALPGRAVIVPESRGRGSSAGMPSGTLAVRAKEIVEFIDALHLDEVVLIGHSLGGAMALEIALLEPPEVRALVLISTGAKLRVREEIFGAVRDGALLFDPYAPELAAKERAYFTALEASVPTEAALLDWISADGFDRMKEVRTITLPAFVLAGEDDAMTPPKYARYLAETMQSAELHIVKGAAHMMAAERPREIGILIEAFLTRCGL